MTVMGEAENIERLGGRGETGGGRGEAQKRAAG